MLITHVESFLFNPGSTRNLLFCRIETDSGLYGWGEAYVTAEKEKAVDEYLRAMAPHLIGRSPFNIRHTGQVLFDDFVIRRSSIGFLSAWSAIEMALWDIVGKQAGLPLHDIMGGASRERVRVYANGWADEPGTVDDYVERALKVKELGYTALKFDPLPGPWRNFIHREDEEFAVNYVRLMREALGPDMELLIEMHRRLAPSYAIRLGRRLAEFDIHWYEEPCLSDNIDLVAEVRRNQPIPVVTGETIYTKESYAQVLEKRAADILNPDICAVGGITALMDIATMAQPHAVAISPHNNNSTLAGLAATVHVCAVIPNFTIAECFINRLHACDEIALSSIKVEAGWAELPKTPGLGIDIDVERLRKFPYRHYPPKGLRQYWEEFPRKNYAIPRFMQGAGGVVSEENAQ
ncbi:MULTISPECIES: mandelate racemase/muconate lactonizing enzyme family protein [Chelativorans]|jgi:galactonate dehydratase|uniref:Mandelate racemase/muconate lactonizing enzyme-like protein n=1 Tax=Chelativorans sp. (strain BNC1) TaxID=266779 RepID=Q11AM8_CHESB|nr:MULTISPECIES: mandelate racemase/muconate lactonizing enzyme family protein [Chelativorans]